MARWVAERTYMTARWGSLLGALTVVTGVLVAAPVPEAGTAAAASQTAAPSLQRVLWGSVSDAADLPLIAAGTDKASYLRQRDAAEAERRGNPLAADGRNLRVAAIRQQQQADRGLGASSPASDATTTLDNSPAWAPL